MKLDELEGSALATLDEMLGYLNLSSGSPDAKFQTNLNEFYARLEGDLTATEPPWSVLARLLSDRLTALEGTSAAFTDTVQARAVVQLALTDLPVAYRRFHRDLLLGRTEAELFRPLFLARVCEAVLNQGGPWDETERIVADCLARLNDFIGYRPVATLQTQQKLQPYAHEWVRPIPLYVRGAGVAAGRYAKLIARTLEVLAETDPEVLDQACLDPELLDELAVDPKEYDFDHPANKRPGYHFGQWDPHAIDNQGRFRRFVLVWVTLDVMTARIEETEDLPEEELLEEAALVLAGTMLMAAGISGRGPNFYDSTTTLSTLVPRVASFRDAFYETRLAGVTGSHGKRLRAEARQRKQAFGGARQDLNQRMSRLRAAQLQQVHLARVFARMGAPEASARRLTTVPTASSRMTCELECEIASPITLWIAE